jgi:hypothetical protein
LMAVSASDVIECSKRLIDTGPGVYT